MRGYFVRAGRSHRGSLCGFPDIEMQHFTSSRRRGLLSVPSRQKRWPSGVTTAVIAATGAR
jgi:hypothetical protein